MDTQNTTSSNSKSGSSNSKFEEIVNARLEYTKATLLSKAKEYASTLDRLYNFKRGAAITGEHPAQVCVGFMTKHLVSLLDIVDDLAEGEETKARKYLDEKLGDTLIYLILLEAIIKEELEVGPYEEDKTCKDSSAKTLPPYRQTPITLQYFVCTKCKKHCNVVRKQLDNCIAYMSECCNSVYTVVEEIP